MQPPPAALDLKQVSLCVASEVLYYNEGESNDATLALASTLHAVLCDSAEGARALLLVRVRRDVQPTDPRP